MNHNVRMGKIRYSKTGTTKPCGGDRGGGGGTHIFSSYVGLGPVSTVYPHKYREYQARQKIFEIYATQKSMPTLYPFCRLHLP